MKLWVIDQSEMQVERAFMKVNEAVASVALQVTLLDRCMEDLDAFVKAARWDGDLPQDVRMGQPASDEGRRQSLELFAATALLHSKGRSLWSSRITSKRAVTRVLAALLADLEAMQPHLDADDDDDTSIMRALFRETLLTCARNSERGITMIDELTLAIRDSSERGGKREVSVEAAMKRVFK